MLFPDDLVKTAAALNDRLRRQGLRIVTAESCTGGLLAGILTEVPGSSDVVDRGLVTYSNAAKTALLAVGEDLLARHGAVSAEVAAAMAQGALANSPADISVGVTGIAGPGGGSAEKPVGLVYIAAARRSGGRAAAECRFGDIGRTDIRIAAVRAALALAGELAG